MQRACKDCLNWQRYGKDCWFYWTDKQYCTQRVDLEGNDSPIYPEDEE